MRIASFEVIDLLGTKYIKFALGTITLITGANETGKSSILRAFAKFFEGGSDPTLIRKSSAKGKAVITFDDGSTATMTVTAKGTTYDIVNSAGIVIPSPRKFIEELGDSMAVDPGKILALDTTTAAGKKALIAALLQVMPISFTVADLPATVAGLLTEAEIGLDKFAKIRQSVEETRRRIGVEARDAEGTVKDLTRSLPSEDEEKDWKATLEELQQAQSELKTSELTGIADIERAAHIEVETVKKFSASRAEAAQQEYERQLKIIREDKEAELAKASKIREAALKEQESEAAPEREKIVAQIATVKEKAATQERTEGARQTIEKMSLKIRDKTLEYDRLTRVIEELDEARKTKLESLPIPGVEFTEDVVLIDGVEWQNVNTARRASVAIQMCALRGGRLPFLILDDAEHLDAEMWKTVKEAAMADGYQIVAAKVSESGPLKIEVTSI